MPKYDDTIRYKVLGRLHNNESFDSIANVVGIPLSTVIRWNKELKNAIRDGEIGTLVDMDRVVLGEVIEKVAEKQEMQESAGKLIQSLNHSERLSQELQLTAIHLTTSAKLMATTAGHASELILLSEVICQLQSAFFNSNSTQINIQNNNGTGYDEFLTDAPAA